MDEFKRDRDQIMAQHLAEKKWDDYHLQLHGDLLQRMAERQRDAQVLSGIQDVIEDWMIRIGLKRERDCWIMNSDLNIYLSQKIGYRIRVPSEYRQFQETMQKLRFNRERRRIENNQNPQVVWVRGEFLGILNNEHKVIPPSIMDGGYEVDVSLPAQNGVKPEAEINQTPMILEDTEDFDWRQYD